MKGETTRSLRTVTGLGLEEERKDVRLHADISLPQIVLLYHSITRFPFLVL